MRNNIRSDRAARIEAALLAAGFAVGSGAVSDRAGRAYRLALVVRAAQQQRRAV